MLGDVFDPATLTLLQGLPIGIGLVFLLQGPWIFALLSSKLRTNKAWLEREAAHTAVLARVNSEADARVAKADADTEQWKQAWVEERSRGDTATQSLSSAATEMGQVASKLLHAVTPNEPTMGAIEATPVMDGN